MGGFPLPGGMAGKGVGGIVVALILAFLGNSVLGGGGGGASGGGLEDILTGGTAPVEQRSVATDPETEEMVDFVSYVFDDTQEFWTGQLPKEGQEYQKAKIVLFDGVIPSGCGQASPEIGPHYCPPDMKVYLDLGFFDELASKFGAPGDFAQAYVIAHEVGHHVQNVLGTNAEVRRLQESNPDQANEYSVKLELQADCYAGVWAHSVFEEGDLEEGDVEEGLGAAEAVGDDRLQKQAGAQVNPESWTHGSSEQRMEWFQRGFKSGDPGRCDTFA
jgi:hypothetical protein